MNSIKPADSRLPELDVLRVIAAIFVLLYHFTFREPIVHSLPSTTFSGLNILTRYGFLGVQLFFLISGFVILMSAEQRSAIAFIKSRAKRLYPTFWIACTITFLSMLVFGAPILKATWPQYWLNMTLLTDFFREYAIDGAYWSIFVEIKFYLFIFLVLLFKGIKKIELIYFFWILSIGVVLLLPGDNKKTTEFLLSHYMPYFAMGSILYLWWQQRLSKISYATFAMSYLLTIYNSFWEIDVLNQNLKSQYYTKWIYNFSILSFLIIFFLILNDRLKIKESSLTLQLGLMTYPLYLIHQNIGIIIMKEVGDSTQGSLSVLIASLSVMLLAYGIMTAERKITAKVWPKHKK